MERMVTMTDKITAAVLQAEKVRCAAMLSNDVTALNELLDPRLVFAHASGEIDHKLAYIAKLASGRINYIDITWADPVVIALGCSGALLTGRMKTLVRIENQEKLLNNRVTSGWVFIDGEWRMVTFQSTPIKN
jgi:hypothetical protein